MAKSKAQRMKEYRQRKKEQLGDKWLKMEAHRVKGYFVPMKDKSNEDRLKRREQNRNSQVTFRHKHKKEINTDNPIIDSNEQQSDNGNMVTSTTESPKPSTSGNTDSSTDGSALTVKMTFPNSKAKAGSKRVSRALAKSYRKIETLEDKNEKLQRKLKSALKRLNRLEAEKKEANTPRSKADKLLKESGINPKEVPEVRKQLVFGECLSEEIKTAKAAQDKSCEKTQIVHNVASGKIVRKYRMKNTMEKMTTLNRRKTLTSKSVAAVRKSRLIDQRKKITNEVKMFLERDDNSRILPGKSDAVKTATGLQQKRVLNDYMYNLHLKFLAESTVRISRASFYRCRPNYISLVNFATRSICLCSKHQNFCFLLRALKSMNVSNCTNPDKFVELYESQTELFFELLQKLPTNDEAVKFQQWTRVKLNNGKERQRVVEVQKPRDEFVRYISESLHEFVKHVQRVKEQYNAIKNMKEKLPANHVLIQMDFSENYTCNTLEEIQSAYWNSCMITLHPVVIYYRSAQENTDLKHTSYVYISEVLSHNAAMVISIIDKLMVRVKGLVPNVKFVHFWTDSPSSQYRNKTIFDLVASFPVRYNLLSSWHYFESGHGKGPCDGIGGTTKRYADNAVKQGKVIQDADDFFRWATEETRGIVYEKITEEEYKISKENVDTRNQEINPVKGSMAIHAVACVGNGRLITRDTTCTCDDCFGNMSFTLHSGCNWGECCVTKKVNKKTKTDKTIHLEKDSSLPKVDTDAIEIIIEEHKNIVTGQFIVASYDDNCYIGVVCEVSHDDDTIQVNFMTKCQKVASHFKWAATEDKIWIRFDDIIKIIDKPQPTSKTGRMYTVPDDVLQLL